MLSAADIAIVALVLVEILGGISFFPDTLTLNISVTLYIRSVS